MIAGAGVIGLSLAIELRKHGLSVLIVERGAPGREASHAAAGMLAYCEPHPAPLHALAAASAELYPEYVHELEDESGVDVDLRPQGTIAFFGDEEPIPTLACARALTAAQLEELEQRVPPRRAAYLAEASVDCRALTEALLRAAKHRNIDVATGFPVADLRLDGARAVAVRTERTEYATGVVVNCCGAWAGEMAGQHLPVRPVKGQMLSVAGDKILQHVLRSPDVYIVPRTDGRLLIGATVEECGFDKRIAPETIQRLHQSAANLLPEIGAMKMLEAWAGLRPATPDGLPVLGATAVPGYFVATGHFRNGILLAPVTARLLAALVRGERVDFDLAPFSPSRFAA